MAPTARHAWSIDLTAPDETSGRVMPELPKPPGFGEREREDSEEKIVAKKVDMMQLKLKKAQEVAWSPGKNFMMTAFMLWMSGSGVHIFSIMITFYAVYNPIKSAFTVQQQFSRFEDPKMTGPERARLMSSKLIFVAMNLFAMTGALYKMSTMGLLPNTPSDWVGMLSVPPNLQLSTGSSL